MSGVPSIVVTLLFADLFGLLTVIEMLKTRKECNMKRCNKTRCKKLRLKRINSGNIVRFILFLILAGLELIVFNI